MKKTTPSKKVTKASKKITRKEEILKVASSLFVADWKCAECVAGGTVVQKKSMDGLQYFSLVVNLHKLSAPTCTSKTFLFPASTK